MEQLIWYTVSGAFWVAATILAWPCILKQDGTIAVSIAVTPLLGFLIHQTYRLFFEKRGGFAHKSRRSLDILWQVIAKPSGFETDEYANEKSFLIWETTFYGRGFPEGFRNHDRGAWHYILAFRSGFYSGLTAAVFLIVVLVDQRYCHVVGFQQDNFRLLVIAGVLLVIAGLVLFFKGEETHRSLMNQEIAIIYLYSDEFSEAAKRLSVLDKKWCRYFPWHRKPCFSRKLSTWKRRGVIQ